jgi:DNA-binding response OmpR family regulator
MLNRRILVADCESAVLSILDTHLSMLGYEVIKSNNGLSALDRARDSSPALAVLDAMLPEMTGLQLCRTLKDDPSTATIAIVLLSAQHVEADCVLGFEFGADDYVLKPFSPRELTLRIQAILRHKANPRSSAAVLNVGTVTLDRQFHRVTVENKDVDITATEFKLLTVLMENCGRAIPRDILLTEVWPCEANIGIRTVDSHVRRLRKKLGVIGRYIHTVRSFGYRMDDAD